MSSEKVDRKNPDQRTTKKREEALIRDIARRLEAGEESSRPLAEVRAELSARPRTVYALVALTEEEARRWLKYRVHSSDKFRAEMQLRQAVAIRAALARPVEPWFGYRCGIADCERVHGKGFRNRDGSNRVLVLPCEEEK